MPAWSFTPSLLLDLAQCLVLIVLWLRKPGAEARDAASAAMAAVTALSARVDVVQERLTHMPTSDELTELAGNLKALARETDAQSERLGTIGAQLNRIESYLLTHRP